MSAIFKQLRPERRKMYDDAAAVDQKRFDEAMKVIMEEVDTFEQSDEVNKEFMKKVKEIGRGSGG